MSASTPHDAAAVDALAHKVAQLLAELPQVEAVALGGSRTLSATSSTATSTTSHPVDAKSDIDLYVYTRGEIALDVRATVMARAGGASKADLGLDYWGPGDEWFDAATGIEMDIVYFDAQWMVNQLHRVLVEHQPSLGYTTCFWHTVLQGQTLADRNGWLQSQQAFSRQPYPEPLRRNIVAHNYPVLRSIIPAYANQLEKSFARRDLVSMNHRLTALLASYFDIIFAINRVAHPGEKQLVARMQALCDRLPIAAATEINTIIRAAAPCDPQFMVLLHQLLDHLDDFLIQAGFDLDTNVPPRDESSF